MSDSHRENVQTVRVDSEPLIPTEGMFILRPDQRRTPVRVPSDSPYIRTVLDSDAIDAIVERLSMEIRHAVPSGHRLVLVGIQRRGDVIARRLAEALSAGRGPVVTGSLDITLYRDDFAQIGALPLIGTTDIPDDISGAHVIIVDDVLYTGRTIRAALNELADFGRAEKVELCVLVDRGGRELPIQPDYAGQVLDVPDGTQVSVRVRELDGEWGVDLVDLAARDEAADAE